MNDLEELTRVELQSLPGNLSLDFGIEPTELIETARGIRTRRLVRRTASVLALSLAAGMITSSIVAHRPVRGVPEPAAIPSAGSALARAVATFSLGESSADFAELRVEASRTATGELTGVATVLNSQGIARMSAGLAVPPDGFMEVYLETDRPIAIGLIDGQARWVLPVAEVDSVAEKNVPQLNATVYLAQQSVGEPARNPSVVWEAADGTVRSAGGVAVPSMRLDIPDHEGRAFYQAGTNTFGFSGDDGHSFTFAPKKNRADCYYSGSKLAGEQWRSAVFCMLPKGATNPEPDRVGDPKMRFTHTFFTLDGRGVLVIPGLAATMAESVTAIRYTDASGRQVVDPVQP